MGQPLIKTSDSTVDVETPVFTITGQPFVLATVKFRANKDLTNADKLVNVDFNTTSGNRKTEAFFKGEIVTGSVDGTQINILTPTLDLRLDVGLVNGRSIGGFKNYTGVAKGGTVEVLVSVLQTQPGQKVSSLDVLLDFEPATSRLRVLSPSATHGLCRWKGKTPSTRSRE